ncbi:hypothetical protein D3C74_456810 [compost metagenome]
MYLIEIHIIRLQAAQAAFKLLYQMTARRAAASGPFVYRQACLGSQNGFLPPAFKCQPNDSLGLGAGVDIGRIYEVDSLVQRGMNNIN